jgi:hypothetical protein
MQGIKIQSMLKFVELYWPQVVECQYIKILTNIAAQKGSKVSGFLKWLHPLLHIASYAPE